ncbi:hypothetical protein Q4E93_13370 [Flavitalea sp. BT771]|uniref:hypothetical protein n=1 Tax=Flavitalea sp. BT771 TaxID=3063329 RepID=UPI0026E21E8F|nr:hypothetical protein [Flavitalea sp. BT771]MDO6431588.1 hypothetical protein [Flavitalea sp. BT771]MDV6220496.1 hypothetical protein [Flavitalea sp. BT771]
MNRPKFSLRDLDSFIAAVIGYLVIQLWARHSGIGVSPDSVVYMSTASNIRHHGAINDFTGSPMMDFPAGYPVFLSGIMLVTGLEPMQFATVLNGLLFGTLIFLSGWMMERFSHHNRVYKIILLSIIMLSPCLLEVYSMVWSETLFLLLSLLFIRTARRYHLTHSIEAMALLGVIAAVACVMRYAGVSLVLLGGFLMITDRGTTWGKKVVHIILFGLISISLAALNVYRNHLVTGTLTGYREKAVTSLGKNLEYFGSVFCDWLPFFDDPYKYPALVGVVCLLICLAAYLYRLIRQHDEYSYDQIATSYFLVYAFFLLIIASVSRFQHLDSRLMSPLFIPWLWGSSSWIPSAMTRVDRRKRRWLAGLALVAAACMEYGQWDLYKFNWNGIHYAGIPGYTEDSWTKSPTMDFVKKNQQEMLSVPVYSNAYEGIWFFTGLVVDLIPHKDLPWDIRDLMKEDHFYVVWFDDALNTDLLTIETISQSKHLEKEYHFNDGAVYYFTTQQGVH